MANQFLIKETMDAMRNLSATEIDGLKGNNPIYAGVQLLGYYEKGDTSAPLIYYPAPTTPSILYQSRKSKLIFNLKKLISNRNNRVTFA